jgi:2-polyprenyl-3-methyl-5-hydroxy-6-metoxy-1,4-benzoquinol methylase
MENRTRLAAGSGSSVVVDSCQVCGSSDLESVLFLGYLPPVNQMRLIGQRPAEQPAYPAEFLHCPKCQLIQLGLVVDPCILFPPEYPYTSGTTKLLRDNFAEMYREAVPLLGLKAEDLVVDIGSNDGTLLSNYKEGGHRVRGIEPSQVGNLANQRGIPTHISFFGKNIANKVRNEEGPAKVITATNVFAHIENVHEIVESILLLLDPNGVFISESHYLIALIETLQYDTIYHEHLRYYSLHSIAYLLGMHGLEVIHAKRIPTHGGSIRVYAAPKGTHIPSGSVRQILDTEIAARIDTSSLKHFQKRVVQSKLELHRLLADIKRKGERVYGIGAPSRASTLINYTALDDGILDCVLEVKGSLKTGKYMPGTVIPVLEESKLYEDQPDYAMLLSWHIADELIPKIAAKGFRGRFIVPLPEPHVVEAAVVAQP